jgi:rubrerythrin
VILERSFYFILAQIADWRLEADRDTLWHVLNQLYLPMFRIEIANLSFVRRNARMQKHHEFSAFLLCAQVRMGRKTVHSQTTIKEHPMANLKGSKTEANLKAAFAGESQANRRYLYFANKADIEGQNDVAALFRSTAEGETGHAHGHLEYLEKVGDPATGLPIGSSRQNLQAAVAGETHEYTDMYPGMAKAARDEGFDEIADWFETLAKAERSHANRYQKALDQLVD